MCNCGFITIREPPLCFKGAKITKMHDNLCITSTISTVSMGHLALLQYTKLLYYHNFTRIYYKNSMNCLYCSEVRITIKSK